LRHIDAVTNDQYVIVCYFAAVALVLAFAWGGYLYLRHPFIAFARVLSPRWTPSRSRRFLLALIFFPAFAGVFSVSFYDCGHPDYATIVRDRPYVLKQSRAEVSEGLHWLVSGTLLLGLLLAVARKPGGRDSGVLK
jgi:hypothetical protein